MLVNSGVRFGGGPLRSMGGAQAGSQDRAKWEQPGNLRNRYLGDAAIPYTSGLPVGYLHPRSWSMPMKPGGMSARALNGTGTVSALPELGTLMYAGLTGDAVVTADAYGAFSTSASLTGNGSLLVVLSGTGSMGSSITSVGALAALMRAAGVAIAALSGTGTLTGTAGLLVNLAAGLQGTGALSADMLGAALASAGLTGTGTVNAQGIAAALLNAALAGTSTVTADAFSAALMEAGITGTGTVTADAIAAVLLAAGLLGTGTLAADGFGSALLSAGLTGAGSVGSSLVGVFTMDGALTALGTFAGVMGGQAYLDASLLGTGVLNAVPYSLGGMTAHISNAGEVLTPDAVAAAVWAHISALGLIQTADDTLTAVLAGGGSITIGDVQTAMTLQGYTMARGEFLEQLDPERQDGVTQILMQLRAGCIALEQAVSQTIPLPYAAYSPRPVIGPSDQQPPVPEPTPPLALPAVVPVTGLPANYRFMPRQPLNGVRDGVNKIFTTVVPFVSGDSVREVVYRSGVRVPVTDYRVNTAERSITFLRAPQPTDTLYLDAYVETAP